MLLLSRYEAKRLVETTSELLEQVQRLEEEQAQLRFRLDGQRQLRILTAQVSAAAKAAVVGDAIEPFSRTIREPILRGRAGGLARARTAWRYFDGTFMPESAKLEAFRVEYERYAAGGRARSWGARDPRGRFI